MRPQVFGSRAVALGLGLSLAAALACHDGPAPAFRPGPEVERTLALCGGVRVTVPDNLEVVERGDQVQLTAHGFPTITLACQPNTDGERSIGISALDGDIHGGYSTGSTLWTCDAHDVGAHEDLVAGVCWSLMAVESD